VRLLDRLIAPPLSRAWELGYQAALNDSEGQTSDAFIDLKRWIESHESFDDGAGYVGFDVYDVLSEVSRLIDEY
jgi:hypothetical protein